MSAHVVTFDPILLPRPTVAETGLLSIPEFGSVTWLEERYSSRCQVKKTVKRFRHDSSVVVEYESAGSPCRLEVRPCLEFLAEHGRLHIEVIEDLVILRHGEGAVYFGAEAERIELTGDPARPFVAATRAGQCPAPPVGDALAPADATEVYGGKAIMLRRDALAAYRSLRAAARRELP
ncbi:MAG: hypothetical protein K2Q23_09470, partial [Bryobacteraceae bacterium]|nr:hypothetical protein [Bryobacteraceae bacterium]